MNAPRVLCIEDNPVNWRLVQRLLTQAGFEMHWAEEGMRGFQMALELKPDLILLDINLPGLSGFELATKFRAHPELKTLKVVALTAKSLKSDRETALVAGCDGFIPKPIDPFTFVQQVRGYLGGQKDEVEQGREQVALRSLNVQVLEHLEQQLKEATEANAKLLAVQIALEGRNQSLSRLLALSQMVVQEHDPQRLLERILDEVRGAFKLSHLSAYRRHSSGGYWEGLRTQGDTLVRIQAVPIDHPLGRRLQGLLPQPTPLVGDALRHHKAYDEGLAAGVWDMSGEPGLVLMPDHQNNLELWGFWALTRSKGDPWSHGDLDALSLYARMALTSIENAELIVSLDASGRALASSYERMEAAYQDLQQTRDQILQRERHQRLEKLFHKIAERLQAPVGALKELMATLEPQHDSTGDLKHEVGRIDGILKALTRRTQKSDAGVPEWLDLNDLIAQEMELIAAEWGLDGDQAPRMSFTTEEASTFGIYRDFAEILQHMLQHSTPPIEGRGSLELRTWRKEEEFHLEVRDEAGVIPPHALEVAFEPFNTLHESPVMGVRMPGKDLALLRQILLSYHGQCELANTEEGTRLHVWFPLN